MSASSRSVSSVEPVHDSSNSRFIPRTASGERVAISAASALGGGQRLVDDVSHEPESVASLPLIMRPV